MDKESKSGGGPSPSGIIAIVMLTAGILFIREVPLETTRLPANEPRIQQGVGQDVDARLWQDPFGAVARAREEASKRNPDEARKPDKVHTARNLQNEIALEMQRSGRTVEMFAVMLPGGPYSDDVETRRRVRYAVLAGLNASRLVPVNGEHLGYFFPSADRNNRTLPEIVPYEWFEPAPESRFAMSDQASIPLVLVLWLDGDAMGGQPLAKVRSLVSKFEAQTLSWRVLGPGSSSALREMLLELRRQGADQPIAAAYEKMRLRFYSDVATAPDDQLLVDKQDLAQKTSLSTYLARYNVQLVRTIGDDSVLANAVIDELKLRGLNAVKGTTEAASRPSARQKPRGPAKEDCDLDNQSLDRPSHIGVVSEWDTLYGRTLRREFRLTPEEEGFCVHPSNYVRGLDGQLPAVGGGDSSAPKPAASKSGSGGKDEGRRSDGTFIEIAEGQSQFDYLRRLAIRMADLDQDIRRRSPDGKGLAAVGVLGSDVHDKLLVLQALQPALPNAIFFTTDLDARFLHPRETAWARNLIVGSNFGLRLSDSMQRGLPPFRDGYQSAAFFATILAMDDTRRALRAEVNSKPNDPLDVPTSQETILRWLETPRIFEIGRTAAFDFSPAPTPAAAGAAMANAMLPMATATAQTPRLPGRLRARCEGPNWSECQNIHPEPSPAYPALKPVTVALVLGLLILPLWLTPLLVSRTLRRDLRVRFFEAGSPRGRARLWGVALCLLASVNVVLPMWFGAHWGAFAGWLTLDGKPMVALEGISLWPTEGLRLLALVLCVYLIYAGWIALAENLDEIVPRFALGTDRRSVLADDAKAQPAPRPKVPWWYRVASMFSLERPLWRSYIVQNRFGARAARVAVYVLAALGVSWLLNAALQDVRFVPQRGALSLTVHECLHVLLLIAIYVLVFFVVDATAFCVGFVRALRAQGANWPDSTLDQFESKLGVPRSHLDGWIDLEFIARRTKCVTRLIYFPFIVLSLFLVSRSAAFDDWYMPTVGIVLALLGAGVALACAVVLRYSAEASRHDAMERLRDDISQAGGDAQAKLKLLLERMDHLHEGAFAPFWQQPLLKAVLLPFATLGGTSLLDYLALVNV